MFGMGGVELLVVGTVALIVVGPKDLPVLFKQVGGFVGKARGMAREFTSAMNDAADQSGVRDLQKTLSTVTNPVQSAVNSVGDSVKASLDPDAAKPASGLTPEQELDKKRIEANAARAAAERKKREADAAAAKAAELETDLQLAQASSDAPEADARKEQS